MTADRAVLREQIARALYQQVYLLGDWARVGVIRNRFLERADAVMPFVSDALAAVEAERDTARAEGYLAGVEAAQEELVKRDQFTERTLRILDDLIAAYRKEHPDHA